MNIDPSQHRKRRAFIGFGLAATAGTAIRPAARAQPPNENIQLAVIGSGGRGNANIGGATGAGAKVYSLCDINRNTLEGSKKKFTGAKTTTDWREIIADPAIDAVVISTADHHHAPAAIAAMRAKKHVYVEKPLAHTVQEARWMQEEYKKHDGKLATQMGTQIHANDNYRRTVELIQAGAIGTVKEAHVWCGRTIKPIGKPVLDPDPIPEHLDWDVWLGPAPAREHSTGYWKGGNLNWNRRWDFGNGVLGDMGSHLIDLPWWAMNLRHPVKVHSQGTPADPVAAPPSQIIQWDHPNDQKVFWYHGPEGMKTRSERLQKQIGSDTDLSKWHIGVAFIGTEGILVSDYGKHVLSPGKKFADYKRPEQSIPKSIGHYKEWIEACKGNGKTLCNFDYSGTLIEHNLLGNVAHRAGKPLDWDAKTGKITNHEEANQYLTKTYRKGWEI